MDNNAMFKLSYGLFVLTANENGKDNGCIINTAMQVTAEPNKMCICINKENYTHDMVLRTGKFNVSVISQKADISLFERFGFNSGRDKDKFGNFDKFKRSENGILYVTEGINAYISVETEDTVDLGTHTMFIGKVTEAEIVDDAPSATYEYYFEHIKPKPSEMSSGKTVWRCRICGYEYEGEELPEDFICPLCKHPASDFEKITK